MKKYKVLKSDLISPFQDFQYEIGKVRFHLMTQATLDEYIQKVTDMKDSLNRYLEYLECIESIHNFEEWKVGDTAKRGFDKVEILGIDEEKCRLKITESPHGRLCHCHARLDSLERE